jgi:two-component system response regulator
MTDTDRVEILLIEDSAPDAELTMRALQKHNLANEITWLKDGEAAMEHLFGSESKPAVLPDHAPKLVLLDLKLPKVDGLEILRRLKSDETSALIPVVVLTSSREGSDIAESYRLGVNSYIVKPVSFEKFTEAVRQLGMYWLLINQLPDCIGGRTGRGDQE